MVLLIHLVNLNPKLQTDASKHQSFLLNLNDQFLSLFKDSPQIMHNYTELLPSTALHL